MTQLFLFAILPYVCLAVASVGFAWRFATPGGVTARSSQFLEGRALFWGSVPWHYAVLLVLGAHLFGVLFPGTAAAFLGDPGRLALAEMTGLALGLWTVAACVVLVVRRVRSRRLRVVTTRMDALVLALLLVQVATGVWIAATLRWGSVWYLHTAVPWLGSLARLDPQVERAALLPPVVQLHAISAFVLLAVAPFSRLVHAAVAPVPYLWRAPQVVRWNRRGAVAATAGGGSRVLTAWDPDDRVFWQASGRAVATRNLWISIPALFVSFAVWMVWSVVVLKLPEVGFRLTTDQLFWLAAAPGLSGATLRVFYAFMVPILGGRRWTVLSTASLLVPALGMAFALRDPTTSFGTLLALALLSGLGGGNFASSMANISFFFPKERKGTALGLNAGLGNLGVSAMQFLVPVAIAVPLFGEAGGAPQAAAGGGQYWLQNAALVWVPMIVVCTVAAWLGMNDVASAKASFREQAVIFRRADNWVVCFLYLGTFGSFIGFSAGFPLLVKSQFPGVNPMTWAFVGPLLGALTRPAGGWLADRLGGARVTIWNYAFMALAAVGVIAFLPRDGGAGSFAGFFAMFLVLFTTSGIGNGSVFRMIPPIFAALHQRAGAASAEAARAAGAKEAAAVIGFSSAVAAYGAFFVPRGFGASIARTGRPEAALVAFVVLYALCLAVTWARYGRRGAPAT